MARDIDIGRPKMETDVNVKNLAEVVTELRTTIDKLDEMVGELRKLTLGASIAVNESLDKEVD